MEPVTRVRRRCCEKSCFVHISASSVQDRLSVVGRNMLVPGLLDVLFFCRGLVWIGQACPQSFSGLNRLVFLCQNAVWKDGLLELECRCSWCQKGWRCQHLSTPYLQSTIADGQCCLEPLVFYEVHIQIFSAVDCCHSGMARLFFRMTKASWESSSCNRSVVLLRLTSVPKWYSSRVE